ncbi:hypothetical protein [Salinigranum sp. GCM10025319]|uniref:hypothetical protein n=1 Tax=Salinigranum sp. GCM10025319 TaxID=3252687 RepID=UPI00361A1DE3
MRRRSVLRALLGTGGAGLLAGCNGLLREGSDASSTPDRTPAGRPSATGRASPAASGASSPGSDRPYRAADASRLDRPRGVHVRNLASTDRFLTVVVTDGDETVLVESTTVAAGEVASFPDLLATGGRYGVLVETADGARRRYDWDVVEDLDDLWIDLTPEIGFHRPIRCLADCALAVSEESRTVAYEVSDEVGVAEALGRTPAVAVDNDSPERTRATLRVWNRGRLRFAAGYDLPPDVRLLVPVLPASQRYDVLLGTDDGETSYDWQPSVRNTLYASLADGPTFRCGYAAHDLRVRNETDAGLAVVVRVLTDANDEEADEPLFESSFALGAGERKTVPSAVEPVGPFLFEVETGDGRVERYDWERCAPNGPITVAVSDDGVYVSVRPTRSLP